VLPAHLESNFINPDYKGAQPKSCLRLPDADRVEGNFSGRDILDVIELRAPDVGIVTVAPEMDGVLELIPALVRRGQRISLGHSGPISSARSPRSMPARVMRRTCSTG
jgi:N-acetylglucosamine-6-phosphate deacetylase